MTKISLSDNLKQAKAEGSVFIKVESGESTRLHIISPPKMFANIFFQSPPYEGAPKSMTVPFGTQIPGFKSRPQWAFEVVNLENGRHKILTVGTNVVEAIEKADKAFRPNGQKEIDGAGYPFFDIFLAKTGEKLDTKWTVTSEPTAYKGDGVRQIDMDAEITMTDDSELAKLRTNMTLEAQRILGVFRERNIRSGGVIHPAEFGDAIVWEKGFVRDEPVRRALSTLFQQGLLIELNAGFELTELGAKHIYPENPMKYGARVYRIGNKMLIKQTVLRGVPPEYVIDEQRERHVRQDDDAAIASAVRAAMDGSL